MQNYRPRLAQSGWSILFTMILAGLSLFLVDTPVSQAVVQSPLTGTWTSQSADEPSGKIQLSLQRNTANSNNNISQSYDLSEFQGLTGAQVAGTSTEVAFRLVREAGTFDFKGSFRNGQGAGYFTFTPDGGFIAAMRARGYDNLSDEKIFSAAALNVRTQAIDMLKSAGFPNLTLEDVFKTTIFKVTPEYIRELQTIGFKNLTIEELVKARIFKITPEFAREMRESGFGDLGLEELVKARIFKVTPAFARQVAELGFAKQPLEALVKMQIFKVTPEFIREIRAAGLPNMTLEDFVKFRIHKIDADFITRARANGYSGTDAEELIRWRIRGRNM